MYLILLCSETACDTSCTLSGHEFFRKKLLMFAQELRRGSLKGKANISNSNNNSSTSAGMNNLGFVHPVSGEGVPCIYI